MEQQTQTQEPQRKHHWLVIAVIVLILAVGAFFAYTYFTSVTPPVAEQTEVIAPDLANLADANEYVGDKPLPATVDASVLPPIEDDEHFWGDKASPVSIVMYGNLTGAYSRLLIPAMRELVDGTTGVNLVLRNYPQTENPLDYDAAELGECTYVQLSDAGYWAYVDQLLAKEPTSIGDLLAAVTAVGADQAVAQECLDGEHTWDYVVVQKQDAQLIAKLFIAPSFIIVNRTTGDTRIVEGLNTKEYIQAVVEDVR